MSTITFEQFLQEAVNNQALQERLKAATDPESFVKLAVELGQEKGYNFSAQDVEAAIERQAAADTSEADGELSDEALEEVAGGWGWHGTACNTGGGLGPGKPPWWPF